MKFEGKKGDYPLFFFCLVLELSINNFYGEV